MTAAPKPSPLTTAKAIALQRELLDRYQSAAFQQRLKDLEATCRRGTPKMLEKLRELCLPEQARVLPRYGFAADERGLADLERALKPLEVDTEVRRWSNRARTALGLPVRTQEMVERVAMEDRQDDAGLFDWGSLDVWEEQEVERKPTAYTIGSSVYLMRQGGKLDMDGPESTGVRVWPAAEALARYFERNPRDTVMGRRVLELGCGLGLVGLAALAMGAERVLLTDVAEMLPALRRNLELNQRTCRSGLVQVDELDWRAVAEGRQTVERTFGLVCWADCVHWPELFEPLCAALDRLANRDTLVLFSAANRGRTEPFLRRLRRSFGVYEVWNSGAAAPGDEDLRIYRGKRL